MGAGHRAPVDTKCEKPYSHHRHAEVQDRLYSVCANWRSRVCVPW